MALLHLPTIVETLGHDKDGRVVGNGVEAVVGEGAALVDVLAIDNLLGAAAELMPGEDEAVGPVLVVVVGQLHVVLAGLAVDVDAVLLALDGGRLTAPRRLGSQAQRSHQQHKGHDDVGVAPHGGLVCRDCGERAANTRVVVMPLDG